MQSQRGSIDKNTAISLPDVGGGILAMPDFQSLMLPLLEEIADAQPHTNADVQSDLALRFSLTPDENSERLSSGATRFANRVAWAKAYLKRAGLVDAPRRGVIRITEAGRALLQSRPERVDVRFLRSLPEFDNFARTDSEEEIEAVEAPNLRRTPLELMDASHVSLRNDLAAQLLTQVRSCSPAFFEALVVRLLVAMGYGGFLPDSGLTIGRSGDGGVDGLIKEDKLGLDIVCVQAKRWEASVGRPIVQAFAGSMEAYQARKGVMITTSTFTKDAEEYVQRIGRRIVLVNGQYLAKYMIDYDVGVASVQTYVVKRVDTDFFLESD